MRHICIVGTGAAGWMAAARCMNRVEIERITVIGSPEIPSIGVGESNTQSLISFLEQCNLDLGEFITNTDAAVKTGVMYENWAPHNFLHTFKGSEPWETLNIVMEEYLQSFGNKDPDISFHEYYAKDLMEAVKRNHILLDGGRHYPLSYHFDAGKYINWMESVFNRNNGNKQIEVIKKTVIDCVFSSDEKIKTLILEDGRVVEADYFVFGTGSSKFNEKILKIQYNSLSDVLLTNKAWVYPLEYTDKRNQFHPYTVAKTMKCGWRWITPTWSRIGTGYVFSDRHISADEACKEFLDDIGDHTISPRLVGFVPQHSKKTFYDNFCIIGMANGFLEPLDAPGLAITMDAIDKLISLCVQSTYCDDNISLNYYKTSANDFLDYLYHYWSAFILAQYKTCYRDDTKFWKDHKAIKYYEYDHFVSTLSERCNDHDQWELNMFTHTMSAKGYTWKTPYDRKPFVIPSIKCDTIHHEDYIQQFYDIDFARRPCYNTTTMESI